MYTKNQMIVKIVASVGAISLTLSLYGCSEDAVPPPPRFKGSFGTAETANDCVDMVSKELKIELTDPDETEGSQVEGSFVQLRGDSSDDTSDIPDFTAFEQKVTRMKNLGDECFQCLVVFDDNNDLEDERQRIDEMFVETITKHTDKHLQNVIKDNVDDREASKQLLMIIKDMLSLVRSESHGKELKKKVQELQKPIEEKYGKDFIQRYENETTKRTVVKVVESESTEEKKSKGFFERKSEIRAFSQRKSDMQTDAKHLKAHIDTQIGRINAWQDSAMHTELEIYAPECEKLTKKSEKIKPWIDQLNTTKRNLDSIVIDMENDTKHCGFWTTNESTDTDALRQTLKRFEEEIYREKKVLHKLHKDIKTEMIKALRDFKEPLEQYAPDKNQEIDNSLSAIKSDAKDANLQEFYKQSFLDKNFKNSSMKTLLDIQDQLEDELAKERPLDIKQKLKVMQDKIETKKYIFFGKENVLNAQVKEIQSSFYQQSAVAVDNKLRAEILAQLRTWNPYKEFKKVQKQSENLPKNSSEKSDLKKWEVLSNRYDALELKFKVFKFWLHMGEQLKKFIQLTATEEFQVHVLNSSDKTYPDGGKLRDLKGLRGMIYEKVPDAKITQEMRNSFQQPTGDFWVIKFHETNAPEWLKQKGSKLMIGAANIFVGHGKDTKQWAPKDPINMTFFNEQVSTCTDELSKITVNNLPKDFKSTSDVADKKQKFEEQLENFEKTIAKSKLQISTILNKLKLVKSNTKSRFGFS